MTEATLAREAKSQTKSVTQHLFWARELTLLARQQAISKGVPDHIMAQAMLVQSWMLFTGQSEQEARKAVSGLYATSMSRKAIGVPG